MRTIVAGLAKLAKVARPRLAEVRSWQKSREKQLRKAGQQAASLARPLVHPLYCVLPVVFLHALLFSFFCKLVSFHLYLCFSQCDNFTSDLCWGFFPVRYQQECSRCIKLQFAKKNKDKLSASGICSKDGTQNPTQITKVVQLKETTKHYLIRSQNILLYSITNFFDYFLTDSLTQNWHRQFQLNCQNNLPKNHRPRQFAKSHWPRRLNCVGSRSGWWVLAAFRGITNRALYIVFASNLLALCTLSHF